ncbi:MULTISPECIES: spore coat U domain-containing protein [unclassified Acinetobacter]|uniref:Csu type fimbrial protein n=1 Tax=unclassified Acinetobacter TaxID=196816 RepID=UPI00211E2975|nr:MULTISPECIES: spore coat U domain-containing protein [unclassified Acinetobacter]
MKKVIVSAVLGFSSLFTVAHAEVTKSTQFEVKLTVNESCEFTASQNVEFASVDRSTKSASNAKGQLNVTCTLNTPYKIALAGTGEMSNTNTSSTVPYKLYQDSTRTTEWDADNLLSKTGNGKDQAIPVYAKLAGNTNVEAGTYVDTVVATVTY